MFFKLNSCCYVYVAAIKLYGDVAIKCLWKNYAMNISIQVFISFVEVIALNS